jgi:antitoxin PrlF
MLQGRLNRICKIKSIMSYFSYNVGMSTEYSTVTSKGQLVIPAAIRRRLKIKQGTKVRFIEDNGHLILQPMTPEFIDQVTGSLAGEPSLLEGLARDRREERERER